MLSFIGLALLCFFSVGSLAAQEVAAVNASYVGVGGGIITQRRADRLLTLPFFDDFSYRNSQPRAEYWTFPTHATISLGVAYNPPTVGVLTLDAARANGLLHRETPATAFPADTLTSRPMQLGNSADSTIYLSFQFQPGGEGNPPSSSDTLFLDFYSPGSDEWTTVWRAVYTAKSRSVKQFFSLPFSWPTELDSVHPQPTKQFFPAHIPVRGEEYVAKGFRFRFRNLATLVHDNNTPGRVGNSSLWHIDLVHLDAYRRYDDRFTPDVACISLPSLPFAPYTAIPYGAFSALLARRPKYLWDTMQFSYVNLSDQIYNVKRTFRIDDLSGKSPPYEFSGGSENISPLDTVLCERTYTRAWEKLFGESVHLRFTAYLSTDTAKRNAPFRWNDTVSRELHFTDYYAYDTGSPDMGYGIIGVGAQNAAVGVRFEPLEPTAIMGVKIWFNHILSPADRKNIRLTVWREKDGLPSEVLFEQIVTPPRESDALGRFAYYPFDSPLIFDEPYYIGWRQTTADMLNVGLDMQVEAPTTFYRITGQWIPSEVRGAIMIRPVCGGEGTKPDPDGTVGITNRSQFDLAVFPNPTMGEFTVSCAFSDATFTLYTLEGRSVVSNLPANRPHALFYLPKGTYLVHVVSASSGFLGVSKVVFQ